MNLKEFTNYRRNCIVCENKNIMMMTGNMKEEIDDSEIHCIFNYLLPIFRKDFMTFAIANIATFAPDDFLDMETLNKDKYDTLLINKDGYLSFDNDFHFKMKFRLRVFCPQGHYSYESRFIRLSDKSPDITKGYPVANEALAHENYRVVSNNIDRTTAIFNFKASKEPIVVPHMEIINFPHDDMDKFVKKVQNILLLA